jgi:hypothetical protein
MAAREKCIAVRARGKAQAGRRAGGGAGYPRFAPQVRVGGSSAFVVTRVA